MKGLVFDIQRFSLHDGPGIRTVIFFKGCPLQCSWCSNPEGQDAFINIFFLMDKCRKDCFKCVNLCKNDAIKKSNNIVIIDYSKCNYCSICIEKCPYNALKKVGNWYSLEELVCIVSKDIKFYERSSGGVTFSGGEPTFQIDFLKILVNKLKKLQMSLCLETCGYFDYDKCISTLRKMDLIYFDLKVLDNMEAELYTGKGIDIIENNLKRLSSVVSEKITIRFPLIPGITTKNHNLNKIKKLLADNKINNIELLPFHKLGIKKYEMLSKKNKLKNVHLLSEEEEVKYLNFFSSFNVRIEQ